MSRFARILSALAALSILAGGSAWADKYNGVRSASRPVANSADIAQNGTRLQAGVSQEGVANVAAIRQNGDNNIAQLNQSGVGNTGCLVQLGDNLDASLTQTGNGLSTGVLQTPNGKVRQVNVNVCRMGGPRGYWGR
jgi:hypothetical protein